MAAGAGDHLMLSRLGLGEENAETAGSSTVLVHENVVNAVQFLSNGLLATAAGKVVAIVATTSRRGREGGEREPGREPGAGNREVGRPRAEIRYPWSVRREA